MAGRGRGRGRGQMTFNVEAVGIGKGDALPPPTLQPAPLFPVSPPVTREGEYMLALKQELRRAMKGLPYFKPPFGNQHTLTCSHTLAHTHNTHINVCEH
uniref:Uncharacterized protein n=1 Tax=Junco hyemalis TaxID=40217 RepID=A0A8C5IX08_JUNHY